MPKLIHTTLEPNTYNPDGSAITVYFNGPSTPQDAIQAFETDDPDIFANTPLHEKLDLIWPLQNGITKTTTLTAWQTQGI